MNAGLLPLPVRWFYLQALGTALRRNDRWTLARAPSSEELARLLDAAHGAELVVEIGAGTEWIALALAEEQCNVISVGRPRHGAASYAHLVEERVRARIGLFESTATLAAREMHGCADFVLVDATSADSTRATLSSAREIVRPGGTLVVRGTDRSEVHPLAGELGLEVAGADGLLLWRKPSEPERRDRHHVGVRPRRGLVAYGFVGTVIGLAVAVGGPEIGSITEDLPGTTGGGREAHSARPERGGAGARDERSGPASGRATKRQRSAEGSAVRLRGGDSPRLFSGNRTASLGTLRIDVPTVLTWHSRGSSFSIVSRDWRFRTRARRGRTLLSPGTYGTVAVRAREWKLRLDPTR